MNYLIILVPYIFSLFLKLMAVQVNYYNHVCSEHNNQNIVYQTNVNLALSNLTSQAASNQSFYKLTVGTTLDKVFALYLCRGDVNPQVCKSCISDASNLLLNQKCPNDTAALIWYDECMLRYTNLSTFSIGSDTDGYWASSFSEYNVSNPTQLIKVLSDTMNGLIKKAVSKEGNSSPPYFETGEVKLTTFETLYCLVQCTPDISDFECNRCLQVSLAYYPSCCTLGSLWTRMVTESCEMRYDTAPFYTLPPSRSPFPPPFNASPPSPPPPLAAAWTPRATNTTHNRGNGVRRRTITIVSLVLSVLLVIIATLVAGFLYVLKRRRTRQGETKNNHEHQLLGLEREHHMESQEFPSLPLDFIVTATQGFSEVNKLGEGGFGPVYKGTLADGKEIAVKRLSRSSCQGLEEFKNEISLIARLQHRNLVKLWGCCLEGNESLLIYEYMPNKSLDLLIFDSTRASQLNWSRRFNIIDGIARGLLYLHEDSRLRIIHRDLKASNILLDHEMNPKISDFGMARIFGINQSEANTSRVVGTYGYMSPEYALHGLFSIKSDVFSFGVLLLEIVSGKRNWKFDRSEHGKNLIISAWEEWRNDNGLEVMDPSLVETCVESEVLKCIHIGLLCVQEDPIDRPTMSTVVLMLRSDKMTLPKPEQPTFSLKSCARMPMSSSLLLRKGKAFSNNEVTISNIYPR